MATGTARNRKGMPKDLVKMDIKKKGDSCVMHKGPMMVMKIKDRKHVKYCHQLLQNEMPVYCWHL